jgi:hypothetical protein
MMVALLAFMVARSELPESLVNRAAPPPSSKIRPPEDVLRRSAHRKVAARSIRELEGE